VPAKNISPDFQSFIEAISESDRRKLISFLTLELFSVVDLAENIGGNPAAIMRYLELLIEANLVKAADQDGVTFFRFDSKNLELMARRHLSQPQNEIDLSSFDLSEDQQVFIHNYTLSDGSLKMIPTRSKKFSASWNTQAGHSNSMHTIPRRKSTPF
jgi:DNA-binding transcriptional ArsR family regulator